MSYYQYSMPSAMDMSHANWDPSYYHQFGYPNQPQNHFYWPGMPFPNIVVTPGHQPQTGEIVVILINQEMWKKYSEAVNEMMVLTTARELFPKLLFKVKGLKPRTRYRITIHLKRTSNYFFKYEDGKWVESEKKVDGPKCTSYHIVGEQSGQEWMEGIINAEHLKIYNVGNPRKIGGRINPMDAEALANAAAKAEQLKSKLQHCIEVKTLTQYKPVLRIWEMITYDHLNCVREFSTSETKFITCTGYKNTQVRDMKVNDNKYVVGKEKAEEGASSSNSDDPNATTAPANPEPSQATEQVLNTSSADVSRSGAYSPNNSSGYGSGYNSMCDQSSMSVPMQAPVFGGQAYSYGQMPSTSSHGPTPSTSSFNPVQFASPFGPTTSASFNVPARLPYFYDPAQSMSHYGSAPSTSSYSHPQFIAHSNSTVSASSHARVQSTFHNGPTTSSSSFGNPTASTFPFGG
ncbi:unnamed protein product [Caenorhabditis sp. 36 PRJEB53466]|nr:unnamed protein product [Caenorhabditis sp. 36 PRJEB53466]